MVRSCHHHQQPPEIEVDGSSIKSELTSCKRRVPSRSVKLQSDNRCPAQPSRSTIGNDQVYHVYFALCYSRTSHMASFQVSTPRPRPNLTIETDSTVDPQETSDWAQSLHHILINTSRSSIRRRKVPLAFRIPATRIRKRHAPSGSERPRATGDHRDRDRDQEVERAEGRKGKSPGGQGSGEYGMRAMNNKSERDTDLGWKADIGAVNVEFVSIR